MAAFVTEGRDSSRNLFKKKFDYLNKGKFGLIELRTLFKSIKVNPSNQEIKSMINEVDKNKDGFINWHEFREMRENMTRCELNVLAEFIKFRSLDDIHRGFITPDSIEAVLRREKFTEQGIIEAVALLMALDSNGDDMVSYEDLYRHTMRKVPDEWVLWVHENVARGVEEQEILGILVEKGFDAQTSAGLVNDCIERLAKAAHGEKVEPVVKRSYAEKGRGYVYNIKS